MSCKLFRRIYLNIQVLESSPSLSIVLNSSYPQPVFDKSLDSYHPSWVIPRSYSIPVNFILGRPADIKKFFHPTVPRGKTAWPKSPADLLRFGVRWYYDGVITGDDGVEYHKYQLQPNDGKIPSTIKRWRDNNGGTHAVMSYMYIPKGVDVDKGIFERQAKEAFERI